MIQRKCIQVSKLRLPQRGGASARGAAPAPALQTGAGHSGGLVRAPAPCPTAAAPAGQRALAGLRGAAASGTRRLRDPPRPSGLSRAAAARTAAPLPAITAGRREGWAAHRPPRHVSSPATRPTRRPVLGYLLLGLEAPGPPREGKRARRGGRRRPRPRSRELCSHSDSSGGTTFPSSTCAASLRPAEGFWISRPCCDSQRRGSRRACACRCRDACVRGRGRGGRASAWGRTRRVRGGGGGQGREWAPSGPGRPACVPSHLSRRHGSSLICGWCCHCEGLLPPSNLLGAYCRYRRRCWVLCLCFVVRRVLILLVMLRLRSLVVLGRQ